MDNKEKAHVWLIVDIVMKSKESVEAMHPIVDELVKKSRAEKGNSGHTMKMKKIGCFQYDLVQSLDSLNFSLVEEWESQEALDAHNQTEHFKTLVPKFRDLAASMSLKKYSIVVPKH